MEGNWLIIGSLITALRRIRLAVAGMLEGGALASGLLLANGLSPTGLLVIGLRSAGLNEGLTNGELLEVTLP